MAKQVQTEGVKAFDNKADVAAEIPGRNELQKRCRVSHKRGHPYEKIAMRIRVRRTTIMELVNLHTM
jgi:hypothetical protein